MEFGRVSETELSQVNFTLPADGELNKQVLKGSDAAKPSFYVGCAKWGRKEWVGLIYPPKTKEKDFLDAYVRQFNAIELNAIFYGLPKEEQILKWKAIAEEKGREHFMFCPKFSNVISHIKRLSNAEIETDKYIHAVSAFGKHLGPCFLQLSDNFGPKNFSVLEQYLKKLPDDIKVFVEVRHADWFKDQQARKALFEMLAHLKKGAAITDASGRRDVLHMELTIPETFIRFVGNGGRFLPGDKARIDTWTYRLSDWLHSGLKSIYFFLHQHDEADTPLIADYTIARFNKELGANLPRVNFVQPPNELF